MADNPITRKEKYLAKLTGSYTGNIPDPITRVEKYLYDLCQKGISGLTPEEIENAVNKYLKENPVQPGATTEQAQQIEQNKTDIASLKTETGSLKEDLSNKITKFYASSQGETHLADSDNGKIQDMMLYGRSEQKQYSGKNLLNPTLQTTTQNSVTCTANGDGTYTLNGSNANIPSVFTLGTVYLIKDKKYKMAGCPANPGKAYLQLRTPKPDNVAYKNDYSSGVEFVIPKSGEYTVRIYYDVETYNNLLFKPMITTDLTATYDDFEPYTGGQPSPSPDYPQEIKSVVNPTVKVCGKNLLELPISNKSTQAGIAFEVINDSVIKITGINNGSRASQYVAYNSQEVKYAKLIPYKNIAITISTYNDDVIAGLAYWLKSENYATVHYKQNKRKCTIDLGEDAKIVPWFFIPQNGTYTNDTVKFGVYYGTDELTYDAPKCHTVTLPYTLNAIPVSSGGNVTIDGQQYIADYIDVENGKIVKYVKKLFLKPFQWSKAINKGVLRFYASTIDAVGINGNKVIKNAFSISSHFTFVTGTPDRIGTFTANADGTNANIGFAFSTDTTTSSDDFNNWILNNKPFVLLPVLKEELPLTSEQTQALKELATYYPVTNISINSEQLDGYTVFNYPISMANGWNYVKKQLNDNRDYIYDMDIQSAEAYVNSEYAVALTELEV